MSSPKGFWPMLKQVVTSWSNHEAPRLGAALAFYTILSLSPLLLLLLAIISVFFDSSSAVKQMTDQVQGLVGENGAAVVRATLVSSKKSGAGGVSIISIVVLLVSASGVFGELRSALNLIFDVKAEKKTGLWAMARERFFSFGMVLAVCFLLLTSLVVSAGLAAAMTLFGGIVPFPPFVAGIIDLVFSTVGIAVVFALMFRYVPATRTPWKPACVGGIFTAVLFTMGKYLIGLYLAKAAVGSSFGAAGSVVAVIVWVYYSAQIVFLGAEFTHAYERRNHNEAEEPLKLQPASEQSLAAPVAIEAVRPAAVAKAPADPLPFVGGAVILAHALAAVFLGTRRQSR